MLSLIFKDILILTGISFILALTMVLANHWLSNYGQCKISINKKRDVEVKGGNSLLASLADNQIFVPSACGGRGSCGACKCQVDSGGGPLLPTEKPFLSAAELAGNIRLACQVKVKSDLEITLPESIFNIRRFETVVSEIIDYTYDIKGITFKFKEGESIDFKAGQYIQLESQPYGEVKQSVTRAYSIASMPEIRDSLQLIIRYVPEGLCTTWTHQYLKVGDKAYLTGPYGEFYVRDTDADIIYVAGGSGAAPIKAMLEHLQVKGTTRHMTYFFGARTQKDLYLTEEFKALEKILPDFKYEPVLSHPEPDLPWDGKTGFIMPLFKEAIRDPQNTEAYLCGSPGMIDAVTKSLIENGIPKEKIYYDSFG